MPPNRGDNAPHHPRHPSRSAPSLRNPSPGTGEALPELPSAAPLDGPPSLPPGITVGGARRAPRGAARTARRAPRGAARTARPAPAFSRRTPDGATGPERGTSSPVTLELPVTRHARPGEEMTEADRQWPRRIRRTARQALAAWELTAFAEDVELLLSELVTNALRYGAGDTIGVRLARTGEEIHIAVTDGSTARPRPRAAGPEEESGRGLLLVAALAGRWGVSEDGTQVWCSLRTATADGPPRGRAPALP